MSAPIYILPGFLSPKECEEARQQFPEPQQGKINRDAVTAELKPGTRSSRVAFSLPGTPLSQHVFDFMRVINDRFYHFDLTGVQPLQLAEYSEGDSYGWHLDLGPGDAACRKLSASIQLTAPEEYDGGELDIWGAPGVGREQGAIVIFPSYHLHRVLPVTRGVRRALVAWAVGARAYR